MGDAQIHIYKWVEDAFEHVQSITGGGGQLGACGGCGGLQYFEIGQRKFLASAVYAHYDTNSEVWMWDGSPFEKVKNIALTGATDLAAFSIGDRHFLAFACWRKGYSASDYELNSEIWEWDASSNDFEMIQLIPTSGA